METTSPMVWRRWLARRMRELREQQGLRQIDVAKELRNTAAKVSYLEQGERPFARRDLIEILLPLYKVPESEWGQYLQACTESHRAGWWEAYDATVLPRWFRAYVGLEQGASSLRGWTIQLVPGLLQTPAYARAIMTNAVSGLEPDESAVRTEIRLRRQEALTREALPLQIHYVLDEAVLRRVVGGAEIMAEQLAHLIDAAQQPNVTLQVFPFDAGYGFDGKGEPVILEFPWEDDRIVYVESRLSSDLLGTEAEIEDYAAALNHLQAGALTPLQSLEMIDSIRKERL
jgi:transcriptional regulator with XRE-family HTH domain